MKLEAMPSLNLWGDPPRPTVLTAHFATDIAREMLQADQQFDFLLETQCRQRATPGFFLLKSSLC